MPKVIRLSLIIIFLVLVVLQFIHRPKRISELITQDDIIENLQLNAEMAGLLKTACYDCHSNQPRYPWYASVAPLSWKVAEHIEHGRKELNFSEWASYSARKRDHKLEEIVEEVEVGNMPLPAYVTFHSEANLSAEEFEMLKAWMEKERAKIDQEDSGK